MNNDQLLAFADALKARTLALEVSIEAEAFEDEAARATNIAGVTALLFAQALRDAVLNVPTEIQRPPPGRH